jgi:hypothetical protein
MLTWTIIKDNNCSFFTTVDDSKTTLVIFSSMDILCHAQLHFIVELQIIDIRYMTYQFKRNPNTIPV